MSQSNQKENEVKQCGKQRVNWINILRMMLKTFGLTEDENDYV